MLNELRKNIDRIDRQIVELLVERYAVVKEIGDEKIKNGLPISVPEREKAVIENLKKFNNNRIPNESLENIYKTIIKEAVILENTQKS